MLVVVYGVKRHFQQYFSYIVAVSFIGGGNQSTGFINELVSDCCLTPSEHLSVVSC
jgi:hypothetical protein